MIKQINKIKFSSIINPVQILLPCFKKTNILLKQTGQGYINKADEII